MFCQLQWLVKAELGAGAVQGTETVFKIFDFKNNGKLVERQAFKQQ